MSLRRQDITPTNTVMQDVALLAKYHYGSYENAPSFRERYLRLMELHYGPHRAEFERPKHFLRVMVKTLDWLAPLEWKSSSRLQEIFEMLSGSGSKIDLVLSVITLIAPCEAIRENFPKPDLIVKAYLHMNAEEIAFEESLG